MKINKIRIRNASIYLSLIKANEDFVVGLRNVENFGEKLREIGFTNELEIGEVVLPKALGNVSHYNAEGKYLPQKDQDKETYYQTRDWEWKDWGGNTHSKIIYISRKRYPRLFFEPPSEELRVLENEGKVVASRLLNKSTTTNEELVHLINLFLELFGECEILLDTLIPPVAENIIRLNWKLFPSGEYPWERVKNSVQDIIKRQPKGNQPVVQHRIETITKHVPDFVGVGQGGFNDYMVFGFPSKNLFILESLRWGNATYIFDKDWEELSRMTKKEILDGGFQKDRLIHKDGWEKSIRELLK